MTIPLWFELASMGAMLAILIADLLLIIWRPHVPTLKESSLWVAFYVGLALLFAASLLWIGDAEHASQFVAGWLTEYSLSIDNLFVFVIIMTRFAVPREQQQRVLMVGIIIALVLRGAFILVGAQIIERFSWVFFIFGAWLIYTAWKQAFSDDEDSGDDNALVRMLKRRVNMTEHYDEGRVRTRIDGRTFFTPMLLVFIAIGTTDLLFAIDSIPAIFGITQNPFLVFAANVFALMGLRQLYFMLGGLLDRLVYLHYGIAFILAFIGVKLVLHALHVNELPFINGGHPIEWAPEIDTLTSLYVILAAMVIATVASLVKMRIDDRAKGETGMHLGPVDAEIGDDGHYHLVDQAGTSFVRPVRIEPQTHGLQVIDAEGQRASITDFDRDALRAAASQDMDEAALQAIRDDAVAEFDARDRDRAAPADDEETDGPR